MNQKEPDIQHKLRTLKHAEDEVALLRPADTSVLGEPVSTAGRNSTKKMGWKGWSTRSQFRRSHLINIDCNGEIEPRENEK